MARCAIKKFSQTNEKAEAINYHCIVLGTTHVVVTFDIQCTTKGQGELKKLLILELKLCSYVSDVGTTIFARTNGTVGGSDTVVETISSHNNSGYRLAHT